MASSGPASTPFVLLETSPCPIHGSLFVSQTRRQERIVVIGCAVGATATFYRPLAQWLSARGADVVIFDWPYTGASFPVGVDPQDKKAVNKALVAVGTKVSIKRDFADALTEVIGFTLEHRRDRTPLVYVGHSQAGLLFPCVWASHRFDRMLSISSFYPLDGLDPTPGAAEARAEGMKKLEPLIAKKRVFPAGLIGLGGDVPLGIFADWDRWVRSPRYIASEHFDQVTAYPVRTLALYFTDDPSCSPQHIDKPLHQLPSADVTRLTIDPDAIGIPMCGHIGAVSGAHAREGGLWERLLAPFIEQGEVAESLASDRWDSLGAKPVRARL